MKLISKRNIIIWAGLILLVITFLLFSNAILKVISILVYSFIVSYILSPIKRILMNKFRLSEKKSAILIILSLILLIIIFLVILIPMLFSEVSNIGPMLDKVNNYLDKLDNVGFVKNSSLINNIYFTIKEKASQMILEISDNAVNEIIGLGSNLSSILLVPIVVYYCLADTKYIKNLIYMMVPAKSRIVMIKIFEDTDRILNRYIIGQLILSLIIMIATLIGLLLFKIKFPIWLSILNGILNIIPYFGPVFGAIPILIIAFLDSKFKGFAALILLFIIQQIEGNILSPKITADSTDIHPLFIIVILLIGETVGGFIGMVIAVPLAVIIKTIYQDINYYFY